MATTFVVRLPGEKMHAEIPGFRQWKTLVDAELATRGLKPSDCAKHTKSGGWNAEKSFQAGDTPEQYVDRVAGKPYKHQPAQTSFQPIPAAVGGDSTLDTLLSPYCENGVIRKKIRMTKFWSMRYDTVITVEWKDGEKMVFAKTKPAELVDRLTDLAEHIDEIQSIKLENVETDMAEKLAAARIAPHQPSVATFYN